MNNDKRQIVKREALHSGTLSVLAREDGSPSRVITGYALLFDTLSAPLYEDGKEVIREMIDPAAVTRELLDGCDIKMTMFHDRQLILARSRDGQGTLDYSVDEKGVSFEFTAPHTADGDKALELVGRGDISGCSFAFDCYYFDENCVSSESRVLDDGRTETVYTVRRIEAVRDFTLAADPAYPDTSCEVRELAGRLRKPEDPETPAPAADNETMRGQVRAMRLAASKNIITF